MDRFQPIAGVWQRACHDHAHGVIEVCRAHLAVYVNLLNVSSYHNFPIRKVANLHKKTRRRVLLTSCPLDEESSMNKLIIPPP